MGSRSMGMCGPSGIFSQLKKKESRKFINCSVVSATPWTVACRLLCPWDLPGKNTRVYCHPLVQGIFPTQGSNPGSLRCRQILYCQSQQGSPIANKMWVKCCELCVTSDDCKRLPVCVSARVCVSVCVYILLQLCLTTESG